jgi:hypothetical protein
MRGKRGQLTGAFREIKIGHFFDYFFCFRTEEGSLGSPLLGETDWLELNAGRERQLTWA